MIAFLTNLPVDDALLDINATWGVTGFEHTSGRGTINYDRQFVLVRDMEQLKALELSVFYCIGPVALEMQIAAWSRIGRARA